MVFTLTVSFLSIAEFCPENQSYGGLVKSTNSPSISCTSGYIK